MPVHEPIGSRLILVRHAMPEICPDIPATQWRLSVQGRQSCKVLAERLSLFRPEMVITSNEIKAIETGQIVAGQLGLACEVAPGLYEHVRDPGGEFSREQFEQHIAGFYAQPDQLVFGLETANQAWERFSSALAEVVEQHPGKTLAVVAHGTVISLLVGRANDLPIFPFWQNLGIPALVLVSLPDYHLDEVVNFD